MSHWNWPQPGKTVLRLPLRERNHLYKPGFGLQVAPAVSCNCVRNGSPYDAGLHQPVVLASCLILVPDVKTLMICFLPQCQEHLSQESLVLSACGLPHKKKKQWLDFRVGLTWFFVISLEQLSSVPLSSSYICVFRTKAEIRFSVCLNGKVYWNSCTATSAKYTVAFKDRTDSVCVTWLLFWD